MVINVRKDVGSLMADFKRIIICKSQISYIRHPTSDIRHPTSDIRHPRSAIYNLPYPHPGVKLNFLILPYILHLRRIWFPNNRD